MAILRKTSDGYKAYTTLRRFIKHAVGDYNPENVVVVGNPVITEQGVASGFSTANYIRPTAFKPENNPWEMVWKITTGDDVTGSQCIFGTEDTSNQRAGFQLFIVNSKFHIRLMTASSGTSWTFAGDGTIAVQPNTTYNLKAGWDGNTYSLQVMEEGASTYITDISYTSSSPIYRISNENEDVIGVQMRSSATLNPFLGSIDLSESYMKVNDEYYWSGFYLSNVYGYKAYEIVDPFWETVTQRFDYTGELQTYTVPEGVTSVQVDCVAASGKNGTESTGGKGGLVKTKLSVTPGQQLKVWVGKVPDTTKTAEYNASDIRTNSADITSEEGLNSRLVVAGAGGSGTTVNWIDGNGGDGGGLVGASATNGYGTNPTGGTQTEGGKAGTNGVNYGGQNGKPGNFGLGGDAGAYSSSQNGGAGGAGWYGGGSGGSCLGSPLTGVVDGLGGAGGSSYTDPQCCSEVSHTQGFNSGNGYVKITYERRRF